MLGTINFLAIDDSLAQHALSGWAFSIVISEASASCFQLHIALCN